MFRADVRANARKPAHRIVAAFLPIARFMTLEASIGRALAVSLHPVLAWKILPRSGRIAVVLGYFGAAYVSVLIALVALP